MTTDTEALICDCPARNMPFGRCCKLEPLTALRAEKDRLTTCLEKANASAEHFEREWYLRGDEIDTLRAQLAEAQRDAEVSKQINRACMELPDDFRIAIELERNSGCVYLLQEGGYIGFDDPCDGIARSISAAIDAAKGEQ